MTTPRPLKFRCWDTQEKRYIDNFGITDAGDLLFWYSQQEDDSGSYVYTENYDKRYTIQSYSGMDDSNKNPIFEGDGVIFDDYGEFQKRPFIGGAVVNDRECGFGIEVKDGDAEVFVPLRWILVKTNNNIRVVYSINK